MRLTNEEWDRHAAIAAAHKHGENHAGWYQFQRYAPQIGALVLVALLGGGAYWIWHHIKLPSTGSGPAGLPTLFWVFMVVLIGGTWYMFRPGRTIRPSATLARAVVLTLLWLGFVVYGVTVII